MLFRKQVTAIDKRQLMGNVLLVQPVSYYIVSTLITAVALAVLFMAATATYSDIEHSRGFIVPSEGEAKVLAERSGKVVAVFVANGQAVSKGERLALIATEMFLGSGEEASSESTILISRQISLLTDDIAIAKQQAKANETAAETEIGGIDNELSVLERQIAIQEAIISSAGRQNEKAVRLGEDEHLSDIDVSTAEVQWLRERETLQRLLRDKQDLVRRRLAVLAELDQLPASTRARINEITKRILELQLQLVNVSRSRAYSVVAPISGSITALGIRQGQHIESGIPLMALVHSDTRLDVELFVTSRAVGYLRKDQTIELRVDSYPYQTYGVLDARITSVSKTALYPKEIRSPFEFDSPMFPVRLQLDSSTFSTRRGKVGISSGLTVSAVVKMDSTTLMQSAIRPLIDLVENL